MLIEDYNHRDEPVEHHGVPTADRDICGVSGLLLELNSSSSRLLSLSDEEVPFVDRNFAEKWNYQKVKYESDVRIPNHSKVHAKPSLFIWSLLDSQLLPLKNEFEPQMYPFEGIGTLYLKAVNYYT